MKVYHPIWEEINVREAFGRFHGSLGYPKIIKSIDRSTDKIMGSATPDYILEDVDGNTIRAEAKSYSSSAEGYEGKIDLVICWVHDWSECPFKVLNLSEHIDDPNSFFKALESDLIGFIRRTYPTVKITEKKHKDFQGSFFIFSKKYDQLEFFVKIKYEISDGLGYFVCEFNVPETLFQMFDNRWKQIVEDLLEPLQNEEAFLIERTTEGIHVSEKTKKLVISKRYKSKDLMDPEMAFPRLGMDVIALFVFVEKALGYKNTT